MAQEGGKQAFTRFQLLFRRLQAADVGDGHAAQPDAADVGNREAVQMGQKTPAVGSLQFGLEGVGPRFLENPLEIEAEAVPIFGFDKESEGLIVQVTPGYS